jgi:hypothetical protein
MTYKLLNTAQCLLVVFVNETGIGGLDSQEGFRQLAVPVWDNASSIANCKIAEYALAFPA